MIVNAIVCAYFVLTIPLSIVHVMRSAARGSRILLVILDTVRNSINNPGFEGHKCRCIFFLILKLQNNMVLKVMLALLTAGASTATSIVYLAHNGNSSANWLPVCQQFNNFCQRASGSLIGSFGGIVVFILLILLAAIALSRQRKHSL